jgi:peroxiredoxin
VDDDDVSVSNLEGGQMETTQTRRLKPGEPAPDFRLPSTRGTQVALSEFQGRKHVVLAFLRGMT